jgi:hypothetical protein
MTIAEYLGGEHWSGHSTLVKAIENIGKHVVIGVLEDFQTSLLVFKRVLPQFFSGAQMTTINVGPHNKTDVMDRTASQLANSVLFDAAFAPDSWLYNVLKRRLGEQYTACLTNK